MKLEVKDVCFSYQDGESKKEIFNGASCEFLDKKFYCITGPSGCGKSTLLSLLGTIDKCESGLILLDGNDIFEDESTYRKKKVGFVFQDYNLINYLDGFENVALAMEIAAYKKDENRIYGALSVVGIDKTTAKRGSSNIHMGKILH